MENSVAKFRGVSFDKRRNKWFVRLKINNKTSFHGLFEKFEDAVNKRIEIEKQIQTPIFEEQKKKRDKLEKNIIKEYLNGNQQNIVGSKFDLDQSTIRDILIKNKIALRSNEKIVDYQKVLELYERGNTIENISKKMGLAHGTIRRRLVKNKKEIRPNRKYFFDQSIFEKIDSEWKSYYLGYFYADAGVTKSTLKLMLSEKDKIIIDTLNNIVYKGKFKLLFRKPGICFDKKTKKNYTRNSSYGILLNSKKVVSDLEKLGCGCKKSLILKFPNYTTIPKEWFNHFIRGYFDGDGCLSGVTFQIISSDDFCFGFQKWLMEELNIPSYLRKCGKVSRVYIYKNKDIRKLYKYLYKDSTIHLERKKKKFEERIKSMKFDR